MRPGEKGARAIGVCTLMALVHFALACSVYDSKLLGAATDCEPGGSCDSAALAGEPEPCDDESCAMCGNGRVEPGEKCDPPEACPTQASCIATAVCERAIFTGEAADCSAQCEVVALTACAHGDGCCPTGCIRVDDDDCDARCGDGVVDRDRGETCEPGDPDAPCVARCEDADPCTRDVLMGRAADCNVRCSHRAITRAQDGDGCCPKGVDPQSDADCAPVCDADAAPDAPDACPGEAGAPSGPDQPLPTDGDGESEPDTDPDSDEEVSEAAPDPMPDPPPTEEAECRELLTSADAPASSECSACVCDRCRDEMLGCYASEDRGRNQRCVNIMDCKQRNGCVGDACYCGFNRSCVLPLGPCAEEIDDAAGGWGSVAACVRDPGCANYWATEYSACLERNCAGPCR